MRPSGLRATLPGDGWPPPPFVPLFGFCSASAPFSLGGGRAAGSSATPRRVCLWVVVWLGAVRLPRPSGRSLPLGLRWVPPRHAGLGTAGEGRAAAAYVGRGRALWRPYSVCGLQASSRAVVAAPLLGGTRRALARWRCARLLFVCCRTATRCVSCLLFQQRAAASCAFFPSPARCAVVCRRGGGAGRVALHGGGLCYGVPRLWQLGTIPHPTPRTLGVGSPATTRGGAGSLPVVPSGRPAFVFVCWWRCDGRVPRCDSSGRLRRAAQAPCVVVEALFSSRGCFGRLGPCRLVFSRRPQPKAKRA